MKKPATLLLLLAIALTSCYSMRAVKWWQPDLEDVKKFNNARIERSPVPFTFKFSTSSKQHSRMKSYLDSFLVNTNTNAFVVIRNDTVLYERYEEGKSRVSLHPSFSVAKSFVGTLIGIAVDKGVISLVDPVTKYLPQLERNDKRFNHLTIQHLLDMRAAIDFDEDKETPFAAITKAYYGRSLNRQINHLKMKGEPGKAFEYQSIVTQLLAAVLEKASGKKVETILKEQLWQPLGMESDALWSTDDKNKVKAFCCLNATALDFAKLGRLYLNNGNWNGRQAVSKQWVNSTTDPDTLYKRGYKNQWWACADTRYFKDSVSATTFQRDHPGSRMRRSGAAYYVSLKSGDYRAEGILGQIVYVNPAKKVVIVRLGSYPNKNVYFNGFIPQLGRQL